MERLNLRQLEIFSAVVDAGSFTAAAEKLYLAQSTVSDNVRALEELLHLKLFHRESKRRLTLTLEGKRVYRYAQDILGRCSALLLDVAVDSALELTLGASTVPAQSLLPGYMARFARENPACRCTLLCGDSAAVQQMLLNGDIHLGFVGSADDRQDLIYEPIAEDRLVLITPNTEKYQAFAGKPFPIKQLKEDPWEAIEVKYPVGSKHTAKVRNFTNFGIFVELEEGVDGLIHISDLSWTKKVKHPSEFTQVGANIDVVVLEIDKENRRLSLGHKQLEENPWDTYETIYTPGSVHTGKITEMMDKGAVITLNEGGEGFATPKHLVKEDGTQAQLGEELEFKVIEFVKETKRIILSHSRTFETAKDEVKAPRKHNTAKKESTPVINNVAASTTLGDLDALAELKAKMEKGE